MDPGQLVLEARRRANFTQAQLARRAGVSQSLVARIETGEVDVSFARTLELVRACGFDLDVHLVPLDEDAIAMAERGAAATPDERLDRLLSGLEMFEEGRRARGDHDG